MADSLQLKVVLDMVDKAGAKLRAIMGSSKGTSNSLRALQTQFKKLDGEQKSIASYRGMEDALHRTNNALIKKRSELAAVKIAIDATEQPTKQLTRAFEMQLAAIRKLTDKQREQRAGLAESRAKLAATGIETQLDALPALPAMTLHVTPQLTAPPCRFASRGRWPSSGPARPGEALGKWGFCCRLVPPAHACGG